jgi:hypothetical protein
VTLAPKGLLIEEQRTNLLLWSEQFDNAVWTKTRTSITANDAVSPDGTQDADKLVENTDTNTHRLDVSFTWVSGTTYTNTMYAKAAERTVFRIQFPAAAFTSVFADFDLSAGTVTPASGVTASITDVGNGWYRCAVTGTATASTTASILNALLVGGSASYTGDGTSGIFLWGAQLEVGAFPTSYIPTTTAAATRAADVAVMTGANFSNWYSQSEGTVFVEADMFETQFGFFRNLLALNDASGSTANIVVFNVPSNSTQMRFSVNAAGSVSASLQQSLTLGSTFKGAGAYKIDDFAVSYNGGTPLTDTSGDAPSGINTLVFGNTSHTLGVGNHCSTHIRRIAYYPRRLSDAELTSITS